MCQFWSTDRSASSSRWPAFFTSGPKGLTAELSLDQTLPPDSCLIRGSGAFSFLCDLRKSLAAFAVKGF
jgi:hypothetical protein